MMKFPHIQNRGFYIDENQRIKEEREDGTKFVYWSDLECKNFIKPVNV